MVGLRRPYQSVKEHVIEALRKRELERAARVKRRRRRFQERHGSLLLGTEHPGVPQESPAGSSTDHPVRTNWAALHTAAHAELIAAYSEDPIAAAERFVRAAASNVDDWIDEALCWPGLLQGSQKAYTDSAPSTPTAKGSSNESDCDTPEA